MNRSAMDIIIATSWTGTLKRFSGWSSFSMPSVRPFGDVVKVMMEDPATRYMRRTAMNTEVRRPFSVMVNMPNCTRVSPPSVRNRFITTVNRSRITTGFRPLRMYLSGTFDSRITQPR